MERLPRRRRGCCDRQQRRRQAVSNLGSSSHLALTGGPSGSARLTSWFKLHSTERRKCRLTFHRRNNVASRRRTGRMSALLGTQVEISRQGQLSGPRTLRTLRQYLVQPARRHLERRPPRNGVCERMTPPRQTISSCGVRERVTSLGQRTLPRRRRGWKLVHRRDWLPPDCMATERL